MTRPTSAPPASATAGVTRPARLGSAGPLCTRTGFTLIEVVVAFSIFVLGAALAIPAYRSLWVEDDVTVAARSVSQLFRAARDSAIQGGTPVSVVIDSVSGQAWLDAPPAPRLLSLTLPSEVRLAVPSARARFTFAPSGQAFADFVVLRGATGSKVVTLDRWTGDVVVR